MVAARIWPAAVNASSRGCGAFLLPIDAASASAALPAADASVTVAPRVKKAMARAAAMDAKTPVASTPTVTRRSIDCCACITARSLQRTVQEPIHWEVSRVQPMKSAAWCAMLCACGALTAASCRDADGASAAPPPRIEIKGAVAPIDSVTVCAPIEGRVVRIDAAEGAAVKPGDGLIVLTNPAVDRDLAYARAQIAAAELKMRGTAALPPSSSPQGEKSAAAIVKAREEKAARYRALLAAGDVSKQEVADAETEYAMARREWLPGRARAAAPAPLAAPAPGRAGAPRAPPPPVVSGPPPTPFAHPPPPPGAG